jgi:hypothetical protein
MQPHKPDVHNGPLVLDEILARGLDDRPEAAITEVAGQGRSA